VVACGENAESAIVLPFRSRNITFGELSRLSHQCYYTEPGAPTDSVGYWFQFEPRRLQRLNVTICVTSSINNGASIIPVITAYVSALVNCNDDAVPENQRCGSALLRDAVSMSSNATCTSVVTLSPAEYISVQTPSSFWWVR
jgi:hypothetical protein